MPFFLLTLLGSIVLPSCMPEKNEQAEFGYHDLTTSSVTPANQGSRDIEVEPPAKTNAERKSELLTDFEKPLHSYPQIKSSMASYRDDGLLYRKGIDTPFSGRLVDLSAQGVALLEVSFLDGQPHGQQLRRNEDGSLAMEAIFQHGVLVGIKTAWWPSGLVKEEEYWDEGTYKGRRVWEENGRLVKEERVR